MKFFWIAALAAGVALAGVPARAQQPAPASSPRTAEAYQQFLLAQRLENDDDADGAIAAYRRAMELDPASADVPAELASLYMRENRAQDAIATAESALKINADNAAAHEVLGTIYA
ncbi:MAG TPA: tetratricopeptide repeat protein, partial [Vicinamibacterales bacterium]|nr:tetratricopeptide repeat protein [Vicinamibacterales bacterium]